MRHAIIDNGKVINVVLASPDVAEQQGWVPLPEGVGIGDTFDGTAFTRAPEPPLPVPETVTRAQGKAAALQTGLYAAFEEYITRIRDPKERALAEILLQDAPEWSRNNPFFAAAAHAMGIAGDVMDDLFRNAENIQF